MTMKRQLRVVEAHADHLLDSRDGPPAVKVAFTTSDRRRVDQHFGAAQGIAIYQVQPARYRLLEIVEFGRMDMDGNEDKLGAKIAVLSGCVAVYCQAIGASAISKLRGQGVQPIKVAPGTLVSSLLQDLKRELAQGPSAWLERAIQQQCRPRSSSRFDAMAAEGWQE